MLKKIIKILNNIQGDSVYFYHKKELLIKILIPFLIV